MSRPKLIVFCERSVMNATVDLWIGAEHGSQRSFAHALTMSVVDGREIVDPTVRLDRDAAQSLIDELWRCGVRPTEVGSAGQLAATERHLQDMRVLVADCIGVKLS